MKIFKVRFTTEYEMTPFGEVPEILESSRLKGLNLQFGSGGWHLGDSDKCYHEWKSDYDPGEIRKFLESFYGKSLVEIFTTEVPIQQDPLSSNDNHTGNS